MKKILLFLFACLAATGLAQDVPDDITWTSYADFIGKVRGADVEEEYGTASAERYYNAAIRFEWRRALNATDTSYPYLACQDTTSTVSGYELKQALLASASVDVTAKTMLNTDDLYCAFARLTAPQAILAARAGWKMQPLATAAKILPGSLDEVEKDTGEDSTPEGYPTIDFGLCPGEVVSDSVTSEGVSYLLDSTLRESLAWWKEVDDESPRQSFWDQILTDGVESGACQDTFDNQLVWDYSSSATAEGIITLTFNNTDAETLDGICALAVLAALAVHPAVCTVETRKPVQTFNKNAQWLVQTGIDSQRPWFDAGIMGKGQVVAVSDTGIDVDHCYFSDSNAQPPNVLRDDNHRKIVQYIPFADSRDQTYGHGTHVVGTVCASKDPQNPNSGLVPGVAPEAKVAFLDIGLPSGVLVTPRNDFQLCGTGRSAEPTAKLHSASWGAVDNPTYTTQTSNFDQFMFENDDFLMMIAAGNSGDGNKAYTVSSPATAKNIISVGASNSCCNDLDEFQLGPNHIASFSSRGPTADGRTKPDVVAPGKYILSTGAQPDSPGSCDPDKAPGAGGRSGGVLSIQGTSMATPVVSGSAALVRQWFEEGFYPTGERVAANAMSPSGALVKCVLMNGAQFLSAVDNVGGRTSNIEPYDNTQNFGRISFIDSMYLKGKSNIQVQVWDRTPITNGQTLEYEVTIDKSNGCSSNTLSVTLTWMERGSTPACLNCVLNDLDLSVALKNSGSVKYPNGRDSPDRVNNAERVQFSDVEDKQVYVISVKGTNLDVQSQNFALVASACFGGVASTLATNKNVFKNDSSETDRRNTVIIIICSVVGGVLVCFLGLYLLRRRREQKEMEEYGGGAGSYGEEMPEGAAGANYDGDTGQ